MRKWFVAVLLSSLVLGLATASLGQPAPSPFDDNGTPAWDKLVDRYLLDCYFHFAPTSGTANGLHRFDDQLEDYSRAAVDAEIKVLRQFEKEVAAFAPGKLSPVERGDREIVLGTIRARLLELEEIRSWEKNPDGYSAPIANSVFVIMSRDFASQEDRLRSVIAREKQMPAVFDAARANLKDPPRVYTEVALLQIPGIVSFFQKDVPAAFSQVKDPRLLADFRSSNDAVIAALASYGKYLQDDLLPRSHGDFRIGAKNFRRKLLYDEMVDMPLEKLLQVGMADLRQNQRAFKETAARIDPNRTPQQILQDLEKDHPAPDHLLQSFRDSLGGLKSYIEEHNIISMPSETLPIVEETPPFARALTSASMDTPGPFEKKATESYLNVTLPEPGSPANEVEEYMASFNRGTIISTAIHEAYPGHYTQFLWTPRAPTTVRKLLGAGTNVEGWAHYTEQMMLDQGYGNGDLKLKLGQLQDALLRNARYIVGIRMHTGTMTFDEGVAFFEKEGFQPHPNALKETRRGTSDPTYLVYTLGKLQILKLREDYKKKMGSKFTLQDFHDRFMGQGFPPVKIIREAMIGDASPVL